VVDSLGENFSHSTNVIFRLYFSFHLAFDRASRKRKIRLDYWTQTKVDIKHWWESGGGPKRGRYVLTRSMPALLKEQGFLSNEEVKKRGKERDERTFVFPINSGGKALCLPPDNSVKVSVY